MITPKMICLDMDGTIADLYNVPDWLTMLRNFDPTPYEIADPMWDMKELAEALNVVRSIGIEIRVITWLSKDSCPLYDEMVRSAKQAWLRQYDIPVDHFHGVQYGATKADSIRRYLGEGETAILVDDNTKIRQGWHMGEAVNPQDTDIIEMLWNLVDDYFEED